MKLFFIISFSDYSLLAKRNKIYFGVLIYFLCTLQHCWIRLLAWIVECTHVRVCEWVYSLGFSTYKIVSSANIVLLPPFQSGYLPYPSLGAIDYSSHITITFIFSFFGCVGSSLLRAGATLHSPQLEKAPKQQWRPNTAKNK